MNLKASLAALAAVFLLALPLQARPVELSQRSLAGVRAQVLSIDLSDSQTRLDILLANKAPLAAPKYFFCYLHTEDFPAAWRVLTEASRQAIVAEIVASVGDPDIYNPAYVRRAMDSHQANFAPAFWQSFRQSIDSEKWIKSHFVLTAFAVPGVEVQVQPGNIPLQVRYEGDGWRFGFAESF